MKKRMLFTATLSMLFALALCLPDTADAARMGGGRSFGGSPAMRAPAPRPAPVQPAPRQAPMTRQAQPNASGQAMALPARPGMGGLFGGLLAGSLIGSMLSGHNAEGGGAGIGFLDIMLIALLAYFGLKFFGRNRTARQPAPATPTANEAAVQRTGQEAASGWDRLRETPACDAAESGAPASATATLPGDFDSEDFLKGAKMAYTRLQEAWDRRDMNDIAQFATPPVIDAVRQQMAEDPAPSRTEILLVNAQIMDVTREAAAERVQVYFDVLMRETREQASPATVREIWHFLRKLPDGSWKLDGIQQVE